MSKTKIVRIPVTYANAFLLVNGANSVLIDSGVKGHAWHILKKMKKYGINPTDLALIIQTHTHFDHAANTAELKELTGAKVMVHEKEAECLRKGYTPIPDGTNIYTKFVASLGRKIYPEIAAYNPVNPDIVVSEKYSLEEWGIDGYVLPTPGHTEGSQSVVLEGKKIIAGDCFFPVYPESVFTPFSNDIQQLLKTWEMIFDLGVQKFYAGHGSSFSRKRALKSYNKRMDATK